MHVCVRVHVCEERRKGSKKDEELRRCSRIVGVSWGLEDGGGLEKPEVEMEE